MDLVKYGLNPWRQSIPIHASWDLLWISAIGALAFLVIHVLYLRYWPKPHHVEGTADAQVVSRVPERVPRHSMGARLFHWIMAVAMFVLLFTAFLPILGVRFDWVEWHWIAGLVLTASILFHVIHASFVLDFWSIWPTMDDLRDANARVRRSFGQPLPPPRKFGKYPLDNKLYHLALVVVGLAVIVTGLFMMKRVETPFFVRDPYVLSDMTLGIMYVVHGLSGISLVGLVIAHVYFAVRPEKLPITYAMIFGWMKRDFYLQHHDPERWKVAAGPPPKPRRKAAV
jgi:cytochrome b subunit of formate dehydrogenase